MPRKKKKAAILPPKADFSDKLTYLINREGYFYTDVGDLIGAKAHQISRYVHGYDRPQLNRLRKLSKVFNVSIEWLLRKEEV